MKIDLSKEQGTLVPLYFYRKPLAWPPQESEKETKNHQPWQK